VFNGCELPLAVFEAPVRLFATEYRVLPLRQVVDHLARGARLPRFTAGLTFDDGYRSVATLALPSLERYVLPATAILVIILVSTHRPPWSEQL
jgi:peptidoglycan/xylan/chitin deacetylase (PgdA/CDA1 family)